MAERPGDAPAGAAFPPKSSPEQGLLKGTGSEFGLLGKERTGRFQLGPVDRAIHPGSAAVPSSRDLPHPIF